MKDEFIKSKKQDIGFFRGDHAPYQFTVRYENDSLVDITGAEIRFSVKRRKTDTAAILEKANSFAGGDDTQIDITDGENGVGCVYIIPDDTNSLIPDTYFYDLQIKLTDGQVGTVSYGDFEIAEDITRAS